MPFDLSQAARRTAQPRPVYRRALQVPSRGDPICFSWQAVNRHPSARKGSAAAAKVEALFGHRVFCRTAFESPVPAPSYGPFGLKIEFVLPSIRQKYAPIWVPNPCLALDTSELQISEEALPRPNHSRFRRHQHKTFLSEIKRYLARHFHLIFWPFFRISCSVSSWKNQISSAAWGAAWPLGPRSRGGPGRLPGSPGRASP